MAVLLSLDESHRVLLVRFEGVLTDDVLISRFDRVREWLALHGYHSSITDFSSVTAFDVTTRGVNQLAARPPLVPNQYLRIVVAPQDEAFGMTRMFEMLGSETRDKVHVVRSMGEAYELLGVESLTFSPVLDW